MQLPAPKDNETAFGYYRRLIDLIGDRNILSKSEKEIVVNALFESLNANLGGYHLTGEALDELTVANNIL